MVVVGDYHLQVADVHEQSFRVERALVHPDFRKGAFTRYSGCSVDFVDLILAHIFCNCVNFRNFSLLFLCISLLLLYAIYISARLQQLQNCLSVCM
jgi:hypothetical protein